MLEIEEKENSGLGVAADDSFSDESTKQSFEDQVDNQVALIPLDDQEKQIIQEIIRAPTQQELQAQFDAFNMNQSKKNALRIIKLNSLLDKVEDQAIERFEKRPDQVSNKEILEYMQVVSTQIERSQKFIDSIKDKPMIKVNNQKNEVNINIGTQELDREGKERVVDAIQALLKQLNTQNDQTDVIDMEETSDQTENPIVYNNDSFEKNTDPTEGEN